MLIENKLTEEQRRVLRRFLTFFDSDNRPKNGIQFPNGKRMSRSKISTFTGFVKCVLLDGRYNNVEDKHILNDIIRPVLKENKNWVDLKSEAGTFEFENCSKLISSSVPLIKKIHYITILL